MATPQFVVALAQLSGLVFVVTSMVAMGLSRTGPQILAPLRNLRPVLLALPANFRPLG